ncbi:hypothetical protein [Microbacterium sp. NPDC089695]|uniref:hypothetical protein n=1 Tax=Microbacterium sp. NPDC089695 TaxID=3364198 RepID=UPI0038081F4A
MRHVTEIPTTLGAHFHVAQSGALGIGRGRTDAADLTRPFHGVRSIERPTTFIETVRAYLPRLRDGQRFIGRTAVRLWQLPHPRPWRPGEPLEIAVAPDRSPPRARGVSGRRLLESRAQTCRVQGAPAVDPVAAVLSLVPRLSTGELIVLFDALVTTSVNYPGLDIVRRPILTTEEIGERMDEWGRFPGAVVARRALGSTREAVESPKATQTRLMIVAAGLPEPTIQHEVWAGREFVARIDLSYPRSLIGIEYEGDGHRTDKAQWRRDVARQRRLEDLG